MAARDQDKAMKRCHDRRMLCDRRRRATSILELEHAKLVQKKDRRLRARDNLLKKTDRCLEEVDDCILKLKVAGFLFRLCVLSSGTP